MATVEPHGFVWPLGLPPCLSCGRSANDPVHVTPARGGSFLQTAAAVRHSGRLPVRAHAYSMAGGSAPRIPCAACRGTLSDSRHPVGLPSGMRLQGKFVGKAPEAATLAKDMSAPFVAEVGGKLIMATRQVEGTEPADADLIPRDSEIAKDGHPLSAHKWIAGRYVEADAPNSNAALWSTGDLELGLPSVNAGPINWLHEERYILGAIVDSELVHPEAERAAAGIGNHIRVVGALWPWLYPQEVSVVETASEAGTLWLSMECISREVACVQDGCGRSITYREYVRERAEKACEHINDGAPRRFVDPIFQGAGIIVPPVRPGWMHADARILADRALSLVERQAAAFTGIAEEEAVALTSLLIDSAEEARDFSSGQREKLADKGVAMKDGSYPIPDKDALRRAIQAFGRAKNPSAVKAHIIKRARALGATDMLPDGWS